MGGSVAIAQLRLPVSEMDIRELGDLLVDAVESGAAVSFLAPLARETAVAWWRSTLAAPPARAVFLVARDADGIAGTVQLQPAWAPNQPHRAELCKLMVHRRARGSGVARALMHAAEDAARAGGFTLLTLDARRGGAAHALYVKLGWTCVGIIPDYAVDADGKGLHDTVVFYKPVGPRDAVR